jgi:hypothetical protein
MPIRLRPAVCAVVIITVIIVSGCISTKVTEVAQQQPPAVFVDYHRTGGTFGTDDRLVIFDNGIAAISSRSSSTELGLNLSEMDRISALLGKAQFEQLQSNYPAPHADSRLMNYSITYHRKIVTVQDTAIPPGLQPVIDELNLIITNAISQKNAFPSVSVNT